MFVLHECKHLHKLSLSLDHGVTSFSNAYNTVWNIEDAQYLRDIKNRCEVL